MDLNKTKCLLVSLVDIMEHVQKVQESVSHLLERSAFSFHQFLQERGLSADENVLKAYQYQDVMKQQLIAISHAVVMVEKSIREYVLKKDEEKNEEMLCDNIDTLLKEIKESLALAKKQHDDFSGNALDTKHHKEIEFF